MRQYGRVWWLAVFVLGSLLIGVVVTSPRRAPRSEQSATVLPTLMPEPVDPGAIVQALDAIRQQLASFSDDDFLVINLLDVPVEVRVTMSEQAELVSQLLGSDGLEQVTLIEGDLGISPPESTPASMYDLDPREKVNRRHTLLRIVEYEQGGGSHIRIMPGGDIRAAFEDDRYYAMALEFFGPDILLQKWVPSGPGILFTVPAPFTSPALFSNPNGVSSWTIGGLGAAGLVVLGLVVTLGWRRRHAPPNPALASVFLFVGLALVLQLALSAAVAEGHPGWKRGVALLIGLAAFTFATMELSRPELLGRRWALLIFSIVLVSSLAVVHARWLNEQPSHEATLVMTIDEPAEGLPRLAPDAIQGFLEREAESIRAVAPQIRWRLPSLVIYGSNPNAIPYSQGIQLIAVVEANVTRMIYPLELEVRVAGHGAMEVAIGGDALFAQYQANRPPTWLANLHGGLSGSLTEPDRVAAGLGRLTLGYLLGIGLVRLVVPWPWWRDPDEEGEIAELVPDEPLLTSAGV